MKYQARMTSDVELSAQRIEDIDFAHSHGIPDKLLPDSLLNKTVANVLKAGASNTSQVKAIQSLMRPRKIKIEAIQAAIGLAGKGTSVRPNVSRKKLGLNQAADSVANVADNDTLFRAAYVVSASRRINSDLRSGVPLATALAKEAPNQRAHEAARSNRIAAAADVQRKKDLFGPLLGWYINPYLRNEIDCITANGCNFYAGEGTVIGLPGSVHPHCGCVSGPPVPGGRMVNDALRSVLGKGRKYKIKTRVA